MEGSVPGRLDGWEIHGFRTMEDLDVGNMMEEAKSRWLRPNEIHAILCNYRCFSVHVKPLNLPKSGTIVLFDRKMLRNFRRDGRNWKKKNDGKTVKEAHEHLKVGNEERIHVYYAHGDDYPTFVRRCYWLLEKSLEHIVLVHYRETQELQGSPVTSVNNSSPALSEPSASWPSSEESDSLVGRMYYSGEKAPLEPSESMTIKNHQMRLHEINTLEWDELVVPDDHNKFTAPDEGKLSCFEQQNQYETNGFGNNMSSAVQLSANGLPAQYSSLGNLTELLSGSSSVQFNCLDSAGLQISGSQMHSEGKGAEQTAVDANFSVNNMVTNGLQTQDSFGRWMNDVITDSPDSVDDAALESSISTGQESYSSSITDHQSSAPELSFCIIDVSPAWAFSTKETKILVVGHFEGARPPIAESNLYCVCGNTCVTAEFVHSGVYRCLVSSHTPGLVNLYLTCDGRRPVSQVLTFEFRSPVIRNPMTPSEDKPNWEEFQVQMRLAHLLFSSNKNLDILLGKISPSALKEAKSFAHKTSSIADSWAHFIKSIEECKLVSPQGKESLLELTLKNGLLEWLMERILDGRKISERDDRGQGVIHLCAILDYTWAVHPFSWSGLSLDYRDKYGWTALHWAAYYGREKMVATLLSAGAKPNLVTDPSTENPGGCTAADLASKNGHGGLAAYLAEKALLRHFEDMTLAGNARGSLQPATTIVGYPGNFSQEELYLKDTLAAYRTAADAAARIQAAFREHSFKLRAKAVIVSNTEVEVRNIIAAMRIQHAYRNFETRKQMAAAVQIQHRFRTWKIRKDFLAKRHQAIKIQAFFRGFQVRKQYRKIIWSVGVLEKAILRWRWKRKGFRGLQLSINETVDDQKQDSEAVEDFFEASRKQAEERIERSVVSVQAIICSKKAQEEYWRMKLAHDKATLEYEEFLNPDVDMIEGGRRL